MSLVIPADRVLPAWLEGTKYLLGQPKHRAFNLILDVKNPVVVTQQDVKVLQSIDAFYAKHGKASLGTVANTIFPATLYQREGVNGIYETYPEKIYPRIKKDPKNRWGTYAHRLVRRTGASGVVVNPLKAAVERLAAEAKINGPVHAHCEFEVNLIDSVADIGLADPALPGHNYRLGGPCLSHLSFKLRDDKTVSLTGFYRSHYYIERVPGNLIALAQLLAFVSAEADLKVGEITCISSYAQVDTGKWSLGDVQQLVELSQKTLAAA